MLSINKGNTSINYNYLNLRTKLTLGANSIDYLYGANGIKYKKTNNDGNGTRYYFSNFEYDKDMNLEFINTAEGRIRMKDAYACDYYLKDHLGNTRVVFTKDNDGTAKTLQVSNYKLVEKL